MLLSDIDLRKLLDRMNIEVSDSRRPFNPDAQIQPASIDLRLDTRFWFPRRRLGAKISLLDNTSSQLVINKLFIAHDYKIGDAIVLKPGEMVLGRTCEAFAVPDGFAGKVEGRSTLARLGLSIHCTGDFINPGWRGQMPLQLMNHGRVPIHLTPYIDVCQLLIMKTSSSSDRRYGSDSLASKYIDDKGEPSRVWMDVRLRKVREACGRVNMPDRCHTEFTQALGNKSMDIADRFVRFLDELPHGQMTNPRDVLQLFAAAEQRRFTRRKIGITFLKWFPFLLISSSLARAVNPPMKDWDILLWVTTAIFLVPGLYCYFWFDSPGEHFLRSDLED